MTDNKKNISDKLKKFAGELLDIKDQAIENHDNEIREDMFAMSIIHTTDALLEAKVSDEKIISLLQKHYDLRRSEAEKSLRQGKNRLARSNKKS